MGRLSFKIKMGSSSSRKQPYVSSSTRKMKELFQQRLERCHVDPAVRTKWCAMIKMIRQRDPGTADRIVKLTVEIQAARQSNAGNKVDQTVIESTRQKRQEITNLIKQAREQQNPADSFARKLMHSKMQPGDRWVIRASL